MKEKQELMISVLQEQYISEVNHCRIYIDKNHLQDAIGYIQEKFMGYIDDINNSFNLSIEYISVF